MREAFLISNIRRSSERGSGRLASWHPNNLRAVRLDTAVEPNELSVALQPATTFCYDQQDLDADR